jgi:hypothetical protein
MALYRARDHFPITSFVMTKVIKPHYDLCHTHGQEKWWLATPARDINRLNDPIPHVEALHDGNVANLSTPTI